MGCLAKKQTSSSILTKNKKVMKWRNMRDAIRDNKVFKHFQSTSTLHTRLCEQELNRFPTSDGLYWLSGKSDLYWQTFYLQPITKWCKLQNAEHGSMGQNLELLDWVALHQKWSANLVASSLEFGQPYLHSDQSFSQPSPKASEMPGPVLSGNLA